MRFTDAYAACPVCSPTRASIMTGKYPARINLTDWLLGRYYWLKNNWKEKLIPPTISHQMELEEITIAETLKKANYTTGFLGKWHLGEDEKFWPEYQGFDINIGGFSKGHPPGYQNSFKGGFFPPYNNPRLEDGPKGEYLTDRITNESIKFLRENKDNPFFIYVSHYAVHNPQQAKKKDIEYFEKKLESFDLPNIPEFGNEPPKKVRQIQNQPVYAAMIKSVDESVGIIMDELEKMKLDKNTIIIFMSDNGGLSTSEGLPTSNLPLRGGKGWLYEGGIREPMIIKWPGVTKPGSICDKPITSTDFYPTILEMAGLEQIPEQHIDGKSLVPLLKQKGELKRDAIFWHYPHYSNQGDTPGAAIRMGKWKLIYRFEDESIQLFDLHSDISETTNLAESYPNKRNQLYRQLQQWLKDVDAKIPTLNREY
jgi:arylsulfatase A-like enzyme